MPEKFKKFSRYRRFSALGGAFGLGSAVAYTAIVLGGLPDTFPFMIRPVVVVLGVATISSFLNDGHLVSGLITGMSPLGGVVVCEEETTTAGKGLKTVRHNSRVSNTSKC